MIDDDWPLPPPREGGVGLHAALSELRSATGDLLAFGASSALASLESCSRGEYLACSQLRRDLLRELVRVHAEMRICLSVIDRTEMANGVDGAVGLVLYSTAASIDRSVYPARDLEALRAHALLLRHQLHQESLLRGFGAHIETHRRGRSTVERFAGSVARDGERLIALDRACADLRRALRGQRLPSVAGLAA